MAQEATKPTEAELLNIDASQQAMRNVFDVLNGKMRDANIGVIVRTRPIAFPSSLFFKINFPRICSRINYLGKGHALGAYKYLLLLNFSP